MTDSTTTQINTKKRPLISPSIMAAELWDVKPYVKQFEKHGIDAIHFDVMDGQFVPNITIGTCAFDSIRKITNLPIDLHLMTLSPEKSIDFFNVQKGDWVSFHPEACYGAYRLLSKIKDMGARAGIVLSPAINIDVIREVTEVLDFVLLMAVEPGFGGQKMLPNHLDKVARVYKLREELGCNFDIMVDGNATPQNIAKNLEKGADGFAVGTALIQAGADPENFDAIYAKFLQEAGLEKFV